MKLIFLAFMCLMLFSCSYIRLNGRKDKDIYITDHNSSLLLGSYYITDTLRSANDTMLIVIDSVGRKAIFYQYSDSSKQMRHGVYKGHFKKGYFKVKKEYTFTFIFGPLLYMVQDDYLCIGLSRNNELVLVKTYPGSVLLLVAFPVGAAGGGQYEEIYKQRTQTFPVKEFKLKDVGSQL